MKCSGAGEGFAALEKKNVLAGNQVGFLTGSFSNSLSGSPDGPSFFFSFMKCEAEGVLAVPVLIFSTGLMSIRRLHF